MVKCKKVLLFWNFYEKKSNFQVESHSEDASLCGVNHLLLNLILESNNYDTLAT